MFVIKGLGGKINMGPLRVVVSLEDFNFLWASPLRLLGLIYIIVWCPVAVIVRIITAIQKHSINGF